MENTTFLKKTALRERKEPLIKEFFQ